MVGAETYERPAIAGSGTIACGLAACASASSKVMLLARSDASAWRAEERATSLSTKVDDELVRLWDAPVKTPALRWGV